MEISKAIIDEQIDVARKEAVVQADKKAALILEEERKRNQDLSNQIADLLKMQRELKRKDEDREIELQKRALEIEEKARVEAAKKADAESQLKIMEKDKIIADLQKQFEEAKRTAQQGSQQTQGEVLELELENLLKSEFPNDVIREVPKGIRGADVIQEVCDRTGRKVGTIIWESKNAKWNNNWIQKLKDDQRVVSADLAVLLSIDLPKEYHPFTFQNQIHITCRDTALSVAKILRLSLYEVFKAKSAGVLATEKKDYLYNYINSTEFKQKMEAILETFKSISDEIDREKRWFATKWAREEKQLRKAIDNAHMFYGDVQGILGTLPELKSLEAPKEDDGSVIQ